VSPYSDIDEQQAADALAQQRVEEARKAAEAAERDPHPSHRPRRPEMPENLIRQYLAALRINDLLDLIRIEAIAADYDAYNGTDLVSELETLREPVAA
jgi:hypothetical protein